MGQRLSTDGGDRPILSMVIETNGISVRVREYVCGNRYWAELTTVGEMRERAVFDAPTHDELVRILNVAAAAFAETVSGRLRR